VLTHAYIQATNDKPHPLSDILLANGICQQGESHRVYYSGRQALQKATEN
jgi:hypothetical protein